jgi:hypothetical protein
MVKDGGLPDKEEEPIYSLHTKQNKCLICDDDDDVKEIFVTTL